MNSEEKTKRSFSDFQVGDLVFWNGLHRGVPIIRDDADSFGIVIGFTESVFIFWLDEADIVDYFISDEEVVDRLRNLTLEKRHNEHCKND